MVKIGLIIDSSSNIGHIISLYRLIANEKGLEPHIIIEQKMKFFFLYIQQVLLILINSFFNLFQMIFNNYLLIKLPFY